MADLAQLRQQIDQLDAEILQKLSERARCAHSVGELKRAEQAGKSVRFYRPERERAVLERLRGLNKGPLPDHEVVRLFREIMSACLALEQPLQVGYLGPEGTFTQTAALKQFGLSVQTQALRTIADVFKMVETGQCQYGVVPVENSTEGMVTHTLDMLAHSPLTICGEVQMRITQNLLSHADSLSAIETVYSHSQSLAQCRQWLGAYLPQAKTVMVESNAEAAKLAAKDDRAAAIAGTTAADIYRVPIRFEHIEDDSNNTTRFLVLGSERLDKSGQDKTSILVSAHNHPGLLYKLLEPMERYKVNMTRIESRPNKQGMWEYVFFIDLEGHESDMQDLFDEIKAHASLFRLLGSYPRAMCD